MLSFQKTRRFQKILFNNKKAKCPLKAELHQARVTSTGYNQHEHDAQSLLFHCSYLYELISLVAVSQIDNVPGDYH